MFRLTVDLALWESLVPQTGLTSDILNRCRPQAAMYSYNPEPYTMQAFGTLGAGATSCMFTSVRAPATLVPASATAASPERQMDSRSDEGDSDSDSESDIARVHDDTLSDADRSSAHRTRGGSSSATGDERPSLVRNSDLDASDYPTIGPSAPGHSLITFVLPLPVTFSY